MTPREQDRSLLRVAFGVGLLHLAWASATLASHPGLANEPDRVANRLYLRGLLAGTPRLAEQWYFPAPKILGVAIASLGATGEGVAVALAAALLAGCGSWMVARAAGPLAAVGFGVALALDPWWTSLVSTASGDLFVAAGVTAAAAAWAAGATGIAAAAVLLATLVKTPAAACIAPFLLDARARLAARGGLVAAAVAGLVATVAGFALLLGDGGTPIRFLRAYTLIRGRAAPPVAPWFAGWLAGDLLAGTLGWASPLAAAGVVASFVDPGARCLRDWLLASLAVGAAFGVLAGATGTLLFPRFLWGIEVVTLALAAAGAAAVGSFVASRDAGGVPTARTATIATAGLAALLVARLATRPAGEPERFEILYEHGARTAVPWLEEIGTLSPVEAAVVVPLWFQPAAMAALPGRRIDAAETLSVQGAESRFAAPRWILLAPAFGEPAAASWLAEAARGGTVVRSSDVPRMALVRVEAPAGP